MRLLDLPDALRDHGVEPVLVAGWQTRGGDFTVPPRLHLRHWTAGSRTGVTPSLNIVTFGRADLPYNLCQVLQSREGGTKPDKAYVVSTGMAQHAGVGRWAGVDRANSHGTGNEIDWSGPAEPFPANRIETSVRIAAAFQSLHPDPQGKFCCEHREYATPAGRKQDTNLNGDVFRRDVDAHLHGGAPLTPPPAVIEEIPMFVVRRVTDGAIAYSCGPGHWRELNPEQSAVAHALCKVKDAIPVNARQWDVARDLQRLA